jgi:hypothetical protein
MVVSGERPQMPELEGTSQKLGTLVERCWATAPLDRPPFGTIVSALLAISKETPIRSSVCELELGGGGDALDGLLG